MPSPSLPAAATTSAPLPPFQAAATAFCRVVVGPPGTSYHAYVDANGDDLDLGAQEWKGVCATCHGSLGEGGYGPNIASNSLLVQADGLGRILKNGVAGSIGAMPPVGDTWTDEQINALVAYVKANIYKGAPVGASSGG